MGQNVKATSISKVVGVGKRVLVRTVTFFYIGEITEYDQGWFSMYPAICVLDTGDLNNALTEGELTTYAKLPDGVVLMTPAIVDIIPWNHGVPQ